MKTPLYKQIMDDMIDKINKQNMKPNDALESESELEKFYGVSNITVRKALNELEHSGVIYRVKGKGNFVAGNLMHPPNGGGRGNAGYLSGWSAISKTLPVWIRWRGASALCISRCAVSAECHQFAHGEPDAAMNGLSAHAVLVSSGLIIWPSEKQRQHC